MRKWARMTMTNVVLGLLKAKHTKCVFNYCHACEDVQAEVSRPCVSSFRPFRSRVGGHGPARNKGTPNMTQRPARETRRWMK